MLASGSKWRPLIVPKPAPSADDHAHAGAPDSCSPPPSCEKTGSRYRPWAELLKRTFGIDVHSCPRCGGRMRLLALITEPMNVARFLRHIGEPTRASASRACSRSAVLAQPRVAPPTRRGVRADGAVRGTLTDYGRVRGRRERGGVAPACRGPDRRLGAPLGARAATPRRPPSSPRSRRSPPAPPHRARTTPSLKRLRACLNDLCHEHVVRRAERWASSTQHSRTMLGRNARARLRSCQRSSPALGIGDESLQSLFARAGEARYDVVVGAECLLPAAHLDQPAAGVE